MNTCLTSCRECCKFLKDDIYFSPKFTDKEVKRIAPKGKFKKLFKSFENSKKVFRISLIKSKNLENVFVCPYLDEKTQKCKIYRIRPFDCEFWPLILINHNNHIYIAHFKKNHCKITDEMSDEQFRKHAKESAEKWIKEKNLLEIIKKYPELAWTPKNWDFKQDLFLIKSLENLKESIKKGKIFVYPTDTIYGIGCNALNKEAVERIRKIKERESKPFSVIAPSFEWIENNCIVDVDLKKYLPGPYTLILKKKNPQFLSWVSDLPTIGIRIPNHKFTKKIQETGFPFITTSINLSGQPFAKSVNEVKKEILERVDIVIDAGKLNGTPSTLVINGKEVKRGK